MNAQGASIGAIGIDSDPTFVHFLSQCAELGQPVEAINLRQIVHGGDWRLAIPDDGASYLGEVSVSGCTSFYVRLIDLSLVQSDVLDRCRWSGLIQGLQAWLACTSALVVNPPRCHHHNAAKGLHEAWLGEQGLRVPPSITSSREDRLCDFAAAGRTIAKTCSGVRATASEVHWADFRHFDGRRGPVHLQRLIPGDDVRAHVVGDTVIAQRISGGEVDYRAPGNDSRYHDHVMPMALAATLTKATRAMGLRMAGWDFKIDQAGQYWCLEANPMPGYGHYDRYSGGAITRALLEVLNTGS